jgi:hypothetical protein
VVAAMFISNDLPYAQTQAGDFLTMLMRARSRLERLHEYAN